MIPARFEYEAPATIEDALKLLATNPDDTKILAGGHSLIPAMKLRLAQPAVLVDISRIKGLSYIREDGGQIAVGAMTTHYEIESSDLLKSICPLLPECAAQIGDVQVRNKGTIGGSVAHSDPAADWPAAMLALEANMIIAGPKGERTVSASDFFVDMLTTALEPTEILREIRVNKPSGTFGHAYEKVRHPASGFAVVGVAATVRTGVNGSCEVAMVALNGVASKAYRATAVEQALNGQQRSDDKIADASNSATAGVDVNSDLYASEDYRRQLAKIYTRRAIARAWKK